MVDNLVQPYVLAITASTGDAADTVFVYNRTTDETISAKLDSSAQALIDLANFAEEITDGDVLEIKVTGRYEGWTTHTVNTADSDSGGADVSITTAALNTSTTSVVV